MPPLTLIDPRRAQGRTKALLESVHQRLGTVPNLFRALAQSPAVLEAYLQFTGSLASGVLSPRCREQIALAVAEINGCSYSLSAHSAIARRIGLTPVEIAAARRACAGDARERAMLLFVQNLVIQRGEVSETGSRALQQAGFGESEVAEIIATVGLNIFVNYFNRVARTRIDFPCVAPGEYPARKGARIPSVATSSLNPQTIAHHEN